VVAGSRHCSRSPRLFARSTEEARIARTSTRTARRRPEAANEHAGAVANARRSPAQAGSHCLSRRSPARSRPCRPAQRWRRGPTAVTRGSRRGIRSNCNTRGNAAHQSEHPCFESSWLRRLALPDSPPSWSWTAQNRIHELAKLAGELEEVSTRARARFLFHRGDVGTAFYVVRAGRPQVDYPARRARPSGHADLVGAGSGNSARWRSLTGELALGLDTGCANGQRRGRDVGEASSGHRTKEAPDRAQASRRRAQPVPGSQRMPDAPTAARGSPGHAQSWWG